MAAIPPDLLDRLLRLSASELGVVLFRADVPSAYLPAETAPAATRITAALDLMRHRQGGIEAIEEALSWLARREVRPLGSVTGDADAPRRETTRSPERATRDRALILDLHQWRLDDLPTDIGGHPLEVAEIVRIPATYDAALAGALRSPEVDVEAWARLWAEISDGVDRALTGLKGTLHVFAQGPYAACFYLGRCVDQRQRAAKIVVHQFDIGSKAWIPLSGDHPGAKASRAGWVPFPEIQTLAHEGGAGTVLSLEMLYSASDASLTRLRDRLGAHSALRFRPVTYPTHIHSPTESRQATGQIQSKLASTSASSTFSPLILAMSGPSAWAVELGLTLSATVYDRVVLTQYTGKELDTYVPVGFIRGASVVDAAEVLPRALPEATRV